MTALIITSISWSDFNRKEMRSLQNTTLVLADIYRYHTIITMQLLSSLISIMHLKFSALLHDRPSLLQHLLLVLQAISVTEQHFMCRQLILYKFKP